MRRSSRTAGAARRRPRIIRAAIAAIAAFAIVATGVVAMSASADQGVGGTNRLAGLWQVAVNRGPTLAPLVALETYFKDGNAMDDTSISPPTARGTGHGRWEHAGGRTYRVTKVFFRHDAGGAYIGTTKLRMEIELATDGETFVGRSIPEFRDPDGNLLPGSNARRDVIRGTRLEVEPLPDLP